MAKKIVCSEHDIDNIISDIRSKLSLGRWAKGEIKISQPVGEDKRTASIVFTPTAWLKTISLINQFDTEVEWHGLVKRSEFAQNVFMVDDILVPPHKVAATTVIADEEKYSNWIMSLDFEKFSAMKFHGHSHVNMSCNPSGVDDSYREKIVSQLSADIADDSFYIFMIFNKKLIWTAEIYDIANNVYYGSKDVNIDIKFDELTTLSSFLLEAKSLAVEEKIVYPAVYSKENALDSLYKKDKDDKKEKQTKKYSYEDDGEGYNWWDRDLNGYKGYK